MLVKNKELVFVNEYNERWGKKKRKKREEEEEGRVAGREQRERDSRSNNSEFQLNCLSAYGLGGKVYSMKDTLVPEKSFI